jgi:dolichol-phosphate mannosyltransferase
MYKRRTVCVVIPCFNVEDHVLGVLSEVPPMVDWIIAVNDGSRDSTSSVLQRVMGGRLRVIDYSKNLGVGAATRTGFEEAARLGADVMVKLDGDGQMDPRELPTLLDPLVDGRYDYAKGNRLLDSRVYQRMPRARLFGNFALTFLTKLASGYWHVLDPQNGFVAIRTDVWRRLNIAHLTRGYFFENDMLVHLNIVGARIIDVPTTVHYDGARSSLRIHRILPSFAFLLFRRTIYRFYTKYILRDFSPIALLVLVGLPLFLWGLIFGVWAWWDHGSRGVVASTGTVMLSVLPLLLGFQLLLQALVLDIHEGRP